MTGPGRSRKVPPEKERLGGKRRTYPSTIDGSLPLSSPSSSAVHFSPMTLRHKRELLEAYEAEDFHVLLFEEHIPLRGLEELMKSADQEACLDGFAAYSLGCLLERAADLIFRMQDAYSTVELFEA